jgi:hypothetical protein
MISSASGIATSWRAGREVDTHLQWADTQSLHLAWAAIKAMPPSRASRTGESHDKYIWQTCWKTGVYGRDRTDAARNGSAYT